MTTEQIRIAVAEEMGWTNLTSDGAYGHKEELCGKSGRCTTPNYPADLNSCAEMRKSLTKEEREKYAEYLLEETQAEDDRPLDIAWSSADATALMHCRVYLRVKGKWAEKGSGAV
jgi:hypothetical protein